MNKSNSFSRQGAFRKSTKRIGSSQSEYSNSGENEQLLHGSSDSDYGIQGEGEDERLKSGSQISQLKGQVNEVKNIMKDNIEKVIERGENIDHLQDRTDNLAVSSQRYSDSAKKVKQKMQRRNWKMICCLVCVVLVVLGAVTLIVLYAVKVI